MVNRHNEGRRQKAEGRSRRAEGEMARSRSAFTPWRGARRLLQAACCLLPSVFIATAALGAIPQSGTPAAPGWLTQPMSLVDAVRISLNQNADILRSQSDVEAAHGIAIQTRAIVLPKLRGASGYEHTEAVDEFKERVPEKAPSAGLYS